MVRTAVTVSRPGPSFLLQSTERPSGQCDPTAERLNPESRLKIFGTPSCSKFELPERHLILHCHSWGQIVVVLFVDDVVLGMYSACVEQWRSKILIEQQIESCRSTLLNFFFSIFCAVFRSIYFVPQLNGRSALCPDTVFHCSSRTAPIHCLGH